MDENNRARSSSPRRIMKRGSDSIITSVQDVGAAGDGPSGIKKVNVMAGSGQGLGLKRADIEAGNYKCTHRESNAKRSKVEWSRVQVASAPYLIGELLRTE